VRQAKQHGWKPIHLGLAFYAPIVLLWNYPAVNRFFLPFWPLLVAGVWFEGRRVVHQIRLAMSNSRDLSDKCIAAVVGLVVMALACGAVENVLGGMRTVVRRTSEERRVLLRDKEECYAWIRNNTNPDSRLVAYEDAPTYLYTGRETVRPMIFTTDEFYESQRLNREISHLTDVAQAIEARYWLFASDDYYRDWPAAAALEGTHMGELAKGLPVVFQGAGGTATVRLATCLSGECGSGCGSCERLSAKARLPVE
jgi:hypothetical protein